jgi:hypothetical protein
MKAPLLLLTVFYLAGVLGCSQSDSVTQAPDQQDSALFIQTYTLSGDTMVIIRDTAICLGGHLVREKDTAKAFLERAEASMMVRVIDTLPSGAVVENERFLTKRDTGTGIIGRWQIMSDSNRIVAGALSPAEISWWCSDTLLIDGMIAQNALFVEFDATRMTQMFEGVPAELLLPRILSRSPEFVRIDIDTATDGRSVTIVGQISGETVTVTFDMHLNTTYASDRSRTTYVEWRRPERCDEPEPWFQSFLRENVSFADEFIEVHLSGPSSSLNIAVAKIDDYTVTITGNVTGEHVTVQFDGEETVTFSSDNALHEPHTTMRPMEQLVPPGWLESFYTENMPE